MQLKKFILARTVEALIAPLNESVILVGHSFSGNIVSLSVGIPDGSGVWYQNSRLEQYAECKNDDDLVLYLSKTLRSE